jgi:hypothetical protein
MPKTPHFLMDADPNWKATLKRVPPWREKFGEEERTLHVYDEGQLRWYIPPGNTIFEHGSGRPVANINEKGVVYRGGAALCWIDGEHMHHTLGKAFYITI